MSDGSPDVCSANRLGRLDYDADFATISSLTAYRDNVVDIAADLGGLQAPFQFLAEDYIDDRSHQFSQELRFSSPDSSAVKWVGGLFYYEDRVNRTERFNVVVSARSEERRVGKACVSTCGSGWSP